MVDIHVTIDIAKAAGALLRTAFRDIGIVEGKSAHDVVTDADRQSERLILDKLRALTPDYRFHAEESGIQEADSPYTWYVDPLDGTSNFVTGNPYFSVSIALAYNGEVILGVVYAPLTDELYVAEKGEGATLNGQKITVSSRSELAEALVATAYSADEPSIAIGMRDIEKLALSTRKTVINFSPALDLCNIARGRLDALVDNGTTPEDHAAGSLILTEAGGNVHGYERSDFDVSKIGIVATNARVDKGLTVLSMG